MMKAEVPEGKNLELHTGGKYAEEMEFVKEAEEASGVSGNDSMDSAEVVQMLQQVDYSINQNGQIITVTVAIVAGLLVGVIFTLWFTKVWK